MTSNKPVMKNKKKNILRALILIVALSPGMVMAQGNPSESPDRIYFRNGFRTENYSPEMFDNTACRLSISETNCFGDLDIIWRQFTKNEVGYKGHCSINMTFRNRDSSIMPVRLESSADDSGSTVGTAVQVVGTATMVLSPIVTSVVQYSNKVRVVNRALEKMIASISKVEESELLPRGISNCQDFQDLSGSVKSEIADRVVLD